MKLNWESIRAWSWRFGQVAVVLAILITAGYWYFASVPVIEFRVQSGELVAEVMGTGTLEARVKSTISPKIAGRVHEILVDQGDQPFVGALKSCVLFGVFEASIGRYR